MKRESSNIKNKHTVHLGGSARSPEDVLSLHALGLQFAELALPDRLNRGVDVYVEMRERLGIYYLCHGPLEGDPNDRAALKETYLPRVLAAFPLMERLGASLLTIHLWLDARFVREEVLAFKLEILREILERARLRGIVICLENLSESAAHLRAALDYLPDLCLTLDLGHAQLLTDINRSDEILEKYPRRIRHIHLHDNRGGHSHRDDLHLPVGHGIIDFDRTFKKLLRMGYDRTITLELKPPEIETSLPRVRKLLGWDKG
jgi:sugar phosphate isomerase/epimerase